jgi:hypothetical protein
VTAPPDSASAAGAFQLTSQQLSELSLTVQPGSLVDGNGNPVQNPQIGISTVPPQLVQDMLPPGVLQHAFDITIQAPGTAVFTTPATLTMPNVFDAAPGTKLNVLSFDHTTGRLVIDGTATVSADGLTATTDPGSGVTAPGWHQLGPAGDDVEGDWKDALNSGGKKPFATNIHLDITTTPIDEAQWKITLDDNVAGAADNNGIGTWSSLFQWNAVPTKLVATANPKAIRTGGIGGGYIGTPRAIAGTTINVLADANRPAPPSHTNPLEPISAVVSIL